MSDGTTIRPASAYRSLADLWHHRVTSTPDTEAYRTLLGDRYRLVTWASAARTVGGLAAGLRSLGVRAGDRCLVLAEPRVEAFLFDHAAWFARMTVTAEDPVAPDDDWVARCAACTPTVVAADGPVAARVARLRLPSVRQIISFDQTDDETVLTFGDLERRGGADGAGSASQWVDEVEPSDLATITFSAGTTRAPRGYAHTHEAWVAMAQMIEAARVLRPTDQMLLCLPWDHPTTRALQVGVVRLGIPTAAVRCPTLSTVRLAAPSVIAGLPHTFQALADELLVEIEGRAPRLLRWVLGSARGRVPRASGRGAARGFVPRLVDASMSRAERLALAAIRARLGPRLRVGICAGAPLPADVAGLFFALGVPILAVWGLAESAGIVCASRRDAPHLGTVGLPLPGAHVAVGSDGELLVASPAWTCSSFGESVADALFPTGDQGSVLPDGEVVWTRRKFDTEGAGIVELQERIAAVCPWADQVVVFGSPGPFGIALMTPRPDLLFAWANDSSVPYATLADLVGRPEVLAELTRRVQSVCERMPSALQVRRVAMVPERFSRENGLLGPSLAVRRAAIAARYVHVLQALWAQWVGAEISGVRACAPPLPAQEAEPDFQFSLKCPPPLDTASPVSQSSRIPGFYKLPPELRLRALESLGLAPGDLASYERGLSLEAADLMVENVISTFGLPCAVAMNFLINGQDRIIPMVVEEPSVVAAVSNVARLARSAGGFTAESDPSHMIGQIQLFAVRDPTACVRQLTDALPRLRDETRGVHPRLEERGGGLVGFQVRHVVYDEPGRPREDMVVLEFVLDVVDAMGANMVNTLAEHLAPTVAEVTGEAIGLRILSNLADRRRSRARVELDFDVLTTPEMEGREVAERIAAAWRFAWADPYRAATHNKGVMNGIDAVAIATGNDWRAIEAGAHAWCARDGTYRPLTRWEISDRALIGTIEVPLQFGTVGGPIRVHPTVQANLRLLGCPTARELSAIAAAVGLAQNLGALKALATDGIQQGHMRMHARTVAATAGATPAEVGEVTVELIRSKDFSVERARQALSRLRG